MKTIIAGSRDIEDYNIVSQAIRASGFEITEVVSGMARGVDLLGEDWASLHNKPIKQFPANWKRYGNRAGVIRNDQMGQYAEQLIAIRLGDSSGTSDMIYKATKYGLPTFVFQVMETKWGIFKCSYTKFINTKES